MKRTGREKNDQLSSRSAAILNCQLLKPAVSFLSAIGKPFFYLFLFLIYLGLFLVNVFDVLVLLGQKEKKQLSLFLKKFLKFNFFSSKLSVKFPKVKLPHFEVHLPQIKLPKTQRRHFKILYPFKTCKPHLRKPTLLKPICLSLGVLCSLTTFYFLLTPILKDLPSPQRLSKEEPRLTTKIYDRNGQLLYKIYRDQDRTQIKINQMPLFLKQAVIAVEDKDFYYHRGISWQGILRAVFLYFFKGKTTGGSTITQQLVKNTLLNSEKTWQRKLKEAILAILVEKKYTKDQILEMYLNQVGFGGAAYGIEEASQKYFAKSAKDLDLAESALLAGLIASPTRYSPFGNHPETSRERQQFVLQKMVEDGYISKAESLKAANEELKFAPQQIDIKAPHFVMYVKELLVQKYGEKTVETGGLEIKTSLDWEIEQAAEKVVKDEIKKLGDLHITNGAALVTNPKTGEILAMVGSKDYFAKDIQGNFNVTTALRQPGSSIKPVNYSIALENGFTPATLLDDSPITYQVPDQAPYSPTNYDHRFHGLVPLRIALGSSYNVPAVKVLATFGVKKMIERGREMGITSWDDPSRYGLSLTLGGGEVKMTDMAVVYGTLANNGIRVDLNPILEVRDSKGQILEQNLSGKQTPVLNPGVAFLLNNILSDNEARTPAFGPNSQLYIPGREVAVKTGTTQNMRDNWTIGYTPTRLVAVWVGNNDNSPMSWVASGVTGASPIWRKIIDKVLANQPTETFPKPDEVKEVEICTLTGTLTCNGCPKTKKEYFLTGTEPAFACSPEKIREILEKKPSVTPFPQIL